MNDLVLARLSAAVKTLLETAGDHIHLAEEDEREFDWDQTSPDPAALAGLSVFAANLDVLSVTVHYTLQQWQGAAQLCPDGALKISQGEEDPALTPQPLRQDLLPLFDQVKDRLSRLDQEVDLSWLSPRLADLCSGGACLELSWTVSIDKRRALAGLSLAEGERCIFFILAEKLLARLAGKCFADLGELWDASPGAPYTFVLVGNARGQAGSAGLRILGPDAWPGARSSLPRSATYEAAFQAALVFRKEETIWEVPATALTPYHFDLKGGDFSHPGLVQAFRRLCCQACMAYLANRVSCDPLLGLICEFQGRQRLKINTPLEQDGLSQDPAGLMALFAWAYENSSSDKLTIARQIITYQLGDDPLQNFQRLGSRAADILQNAKNNFQYYLRKNVEDYFAKRFKLVELVEKFSENAGEVVSKLTSDLIGDLYKTVGVILGVVVAALISPGAARPVIFWTSLLYLFYVLFILLYALPFVYLRFTGSIRHYESDKKEMRGVLSEEEILAAEDKSYRRAVWLFRVYFALTNAVYAVLASLAYLIVRAT